MKIRKCVHGTFFVVLFFAIFGCGSSRNAAELPEPPDGFEYLDAGPFYIAAPQGSALIKVQGIDSYTRNIFVGAKNFLVGNGFTLEFDFGGFSPEPPAVVDTSYIRATKIVHGRTATIIFPKRNRPGNIVLYVQTKYGRRLFLLGRGLSRPDQATALQMFQTVIIKTD